MKKKCKYYITDEDAPFVARSLPEGKILETMLLSGVSIVHGGARMRTTEVNRAMAIELLITEYNKTPEAAEHLMKEAEAR